MATARRTGFRGGIGRWVDADEAQAIHAEIAACTTLGDLARWADATLRLPDRPKGVLAMFGYRVQLLPEVTEEGFDAATTVIAALASGRRHDAIREHVRGRRLSLPAALDALTRCPACDAPIDRHDLRLFYCAEHERECDAEVRELTDLPPQERDQ